MTIEERPAYLKVKPRRPSVIRDRKDVCIRGDGPALIGDPLQECHLIPFEFGWKELGLLPEFLQSDSNIVDAHRSENDTVELNLTQMLRRLHLIFGITELPEYVAPKIKILWAEVVAKEYHSYARTEESAPSSVTVPDGIMASVTGRVSSQEQTKTLDTESVAAIGKTMSEQTRPPTADKARPDMVELEEVLRKVTAGKQGR